MPVPIAGRMEDCGKKLQQWASSFHKDFKDRLEDCRRRLALLRQNCKNPNHLDLKEVEEHYAQFLLQQEVYWSQRAKQQWLAHGDANIKYFHVMTNHRKKKNLFTRLKNEVGTWVDWSDGLPQVIVDYYKNLFTAHGGDVTLVISCVDRIVTEQHNELLLAPYTAEEVRLALFSMHPEKSPRPDGFNPCFFQTHWDLIYNDLIDACLNCLNLEGPLPRGNRTNIILIPKKKTPEFVSDLRPISLCNVVDRIVCKMMAN